MYERMCRLITQSVMREMPTIVRVPRSMSPGKFSTISRHFESPIPSLTKLRVGLTEVDFLEVGVRHRQNPQIAETVEDGSIRFCSLGCRVV